MGMAFFYAIGALIVLDIVFFLLFISSMIRRSDAKKMKPSKMICPNCGSKNVKLSIRETGKTENGSYKRIAECKECGYVWDYITKEDIANEKSKAEGALILNGILFVLCVFATISILG